MKFICRECWARYDETYAGWRCGCGGALWLESDVTFHKSDIH